MVEIVCTCPKLAQTLGESVQWKLLMRYLERQGVSASIWVEGEETPAFAQVPGFTPSELPSAAKPKSSCTSGIKPSSKPARVVQAG
ncbi:MAG TPA: hypothetical protein V6D06_11250 [Trichocoleus sp.]